MQLDERHEKAYDNSLRVEGVEEEPGLEPVDLAAIALSFISEIEAWMLAEVEEAGPDSLLSTAFVTSEADSIE